MTSKKALPHNENHLKREKFQKILAQHTTLYFSSALDKVKSNRLNT